MNSLQNPNGASAEETLRYAREALSGKRTALIGFSEATAAELTEILSEADAFTRVLSLKTLPSADVFKPFELIFVDVERAADTEWLKPEALSNISDKCVAVGQAAILLRLVTQARLSYRKFCVWPGTAETLLLRCVLALRPTAQAATQSVSESSTVVLADDDPSITALVCLTLQRNGLVCEVASNGGDALELIHKLKPCAAVLDVSMPNIDGFEALSRIRNSPDLTQVRVILLTGREQESDILRGFSLGADDYVTKPFNPMELMMRLKRVIGRL